MVADGPLSIFILSEVFFWFILHPNNVKNFRPTCMNHKTLINIMVEYDGDCASLASKLSGIHFYVQGWAKEWTLGCVNSPPQPEGARKRDSRNLGSTL